MTPVITNPNTLEANPTVASSITQLPVDLIVPNPAQPRKFFKREAVESLADSISRHGILQPLLVRRVCGKYELVAGERRLRAAKLAGLHSVPCIVRNYGAEDSAELAIIENLQREDLNMFEEAEAIRALIELCSMTQETAASHLSCSQSYIANKLRLLKLPVEQRETILASALTERHARALLRIKDDEARAEAIAYITERGLNVAAAEDYVENLLCAAERAAVAERAGRIERDFRRQLLTRDMRLFYNSIDRAVNSVRDCGFSVESTRKATADGTVISILIKNA